MPHLIPLILTTLLAAAAAAPASASTTMDVGIGDDRVTQREPGLRDASVAEWQQAGVDVARVLAIWEYAVPGPDATRRPSGFDPSDPNDPRYDWASLDATIAALRARGIRPIVTVTGPGPVWGSLVPSQRSRRYKPDPAQFGLFASAVARRYGADVDEYIIWNEPGLPLWLQPQYTCSGRSCRPYSPSLYRKLYRAADSAIRAADGRARIYAGALAPRGVDARSRNSTMRPLTFLRALGCVDARYRRDRRSSTCRNFTPIATDGIAHHPHGVTRSPDASSPEPDDAAMGDTARLLRAIDRIQRARGLSYRGSFSRRLSLYFTEYGYQTNPPDDVVGVSPATQARWIQRGAHLAYSQPRVRMLIQYLWRDDPLGAGDTGWQSGLLYRDGRSKPARAAFTSPIDATLPRGRRTASIWGQARPGGAHTVAIERRTAGSSSYRTLKRIATSSRGFFRTTTTTTTKTTYRYRYDDPDGSGTITSPAITLTPRR